MRSFLTYQDDGKQIQIGVMSAVSVIAFFKKSFYHNKKVFNNRKDAGEKLAQLLLLHQKENPLVIAIPRGGVVVGFEVAKALNAPLYIIGVRKLGAPHNKEFGMGAISENNVVVLDDQAVKQLQVSQDDLNIIQKTEEQELKRRIDLYREGKNLPDITNKTVILVDDGLATGVTAEAAINSLQKLNPKQLIFAVPVCATETAARLESKVTVLLCAVIPPDLRAIGAYYRNFEQVTDNEVVTLVQKAKSFQKK